MSKCDKCGAEIKQNVKFCKACGSKSFDEKKARVMAQEKTWVKSAAIAAALVLVVIVAWMLKGTRGTSMSDAAQFAPDHNSSRQAKAEAVMPENGNIRIPVSKVEDGNAHFFAYDKDKKTITFFVMKAADGSLRTAFDACMACNYAKLGYRQDGGAVVCNNCGMGFSASDIGRKTGGCSPIPVERMIDGQMIVLKAEDLEAGARYF